MTGQDGGTTGVHDEFAARGFQNVGAWILGRNMFGPIRGDWPDDSWKENNHEQNDNLPVVRP